VPFIDALSDARLPAAVRRCRSSMPFFDAVCAAWVSMMGVSRLGGAACCCAHSSDRLSTQKLTGSLPWLVKATPLTSLRSAHPSMIWDSGTCADHNAVGTNPWLAAVVADGSQPALQEASAR